MARLLYTVDNMADEVRSQLDEENPDAIDTDRDILPALNRAQDFAFDILARRYPDPLLRPPTTLTLVSGVSEYDMPEDVFEDRLLKMEVIIPSGNGRSMFEEMQRISYRDVGIQESSCLAAIPSFYAILGRKIRVVPAPTGTFNATMWSLRDPEKLVRPQGRITIIPTTGNYLIVDAIGDQLTTESDQLGSYVNLVNGRTGEIRGSAQIQILSNDRITFRTSPLRSIVLGREITGDLSELDLSENDYIAPIDGTCVPYYSRPLGNFMIEYAINQLEGKLEEQTSLESKLMDALQEQVARTWAGREQVLRVKKRSKIWGRATRSWRWWR